MSRDWVVFLCFILPGTLAVARGTGEKSWHLSGKERKCLASVLSEGPQEQIPVKPRDAFALSDPHSGRLIWVHNRSGLARRAYQPGSIFKIITAYAALSRGLVDPDRIFQCQGNDKTIGPRGSTVECWLHTGHGPLNLSKALALSCNLYFADLGMRIGAANILSTAREFGLGKSTGSDLGGEVSGWLPRVATAEQAARLATGQGERVLVTPLQMLSVIAAVANGGLILSPRMAGSQDCRTAPGGQLTSAGALRLIRRSLVEASDFGTGSNQKLGELRLAGKTGTSAWLQKSWKTHAWYVGFAPYRHPLLALVVFVHDGQGSKEAAAIARKVMDRAYAGMITCGAITSRP